MAQRDLIKQRILSAISNMAYRQKVLLLCALACNFFDYIFFRVKRQFFQSFAPGAVHSTVNCAGTKEGCSQMKLDGVRTFQIDEEEEQVGLRTSQTVEPKACHCPNQRQFFQTYANPGDACNCQVFNQPIQHVQPAQPVPAAPTVVQVAAAPAQINPAPFQPSQAPAAVSTAAAVVNNAPLAATTTIAAVNNVPVAVNNAPATMNDFFANYYASNPYQYHVPTNHHFMTFTPFNPYMNFWPYAQHPWGFYGRKKRETQGPVGKNFLNIFYQYCV